MIGTLTPTTKRDYLYHVVSLHLSSEHSLAVQHSREGSPAWLVFLCCCFFFSRNVHERPQLQYMVIAEYSSTQPRRRADEFLCSTLVFLVVIYRGFQSDKRLLT